MARHASLASPRFAAHVGEEGFVFLQRHLLMSFTRLLPLLIAGAAQVVVTGSASALLATSPLDARSTLELIARKGTRNYAPDSADAPLPPTPDAPVATTKDNAERLKDCMATWDAGTHITKSNWKEICKRQLKESDEGMGTAADATSKSKP